MFWQLASARIERDANVVRIMLEYDVVVHFETSVVSAKVLD
jgi:hypothetical protein